MESISVTWTRLEYPENGGEDVKKLHYKILWGEGNYNAEWKVLGDFSYDTFATDTRKNGITLRQIKTYKFKIFAYNSYGNGPESIVLYATPPQSGLYSNSEGVTYLFTSFLMLLNTFC